MRPPHHRPRHPRAGHDPDRARPAARAVRAVTSVLAATAVVLPLSFGASASAAALPVPAEPAGQTTGVDLTAQRAHWIDRTTVLWPAETDTGHTYTLLSSAEGDLELSEDGLGGTYEALDLTPDPDGPTDGQREAWPHLADLSVLTVERAGHPRLRSALTGQLAVVERDSEGTVTAATGVQTPGVLDDVYAAAADAERVQVVHAGLQGGLGAMVRRRPRGSGGPGYQRRRDGQRPPLGLRAIARSRAHGRRPHAHSICRAGPYGERGQSCPTPPS